MSQQKGKVARCEFCMTKNQVSEMKQSIHHTSDEQRDRPMYFASETCAFMYAYEHGNDNFPGETPADSHRMYMETLKKCYPQLYKERHGKQTN